MNLDVLLIADPRFPGGTSTAVAHEARALVAAGYTVGLLSVTSPILSVRRGPHPEIAALTDAGHVVPVPPEARVMARLACIHHPTALLDRPSGPWRVSAGEAVLVAHHPPVDARGEVQYDIARISGVADDLFGPVPWAPVGPAARAAFAGLRHAPELTPEDWVNVLEPGDFAGSRHGPFSALATIGRHSRPDPAKWPDSRAGFLAAYPDAPDIRVRLMGYADSLDAVTAPRPVGWQVLPFGAMPVPRFLTSIDYFSYYHGPSWIEAFGRAPLEAMAAGLPCLLPPSFAGLFEEGALYGPPETVLDTVRRLHADPAAYARQSVRAVTLVRDRFGPARAVARVASRIGPPQAPPARTRGPDRTEARVLYITSNGIGMGHLTRCIASARRLPTGVRPVILTMSKAFGLLRDLGIAGGYLPYFRSVGLGEAEWHATLADEIDEALRFWRPNVAVFDGNVPYSGMMTAFARHPHVWTVWQRRGLWRPGTGEAALAREDEFDAIIEPGELASAFDHGPTAARRSNALVVPPVTYLREDEGLVRGAARAAVGLDPARPAVLLQLGSGNNFDMRAPLDQILQTFRALPTGRRPQVVNADWRISCETLPLPPDVIRLSSFPFARFLAAFDWAIAAAGYNTFHENLAACLPTLFLSNENPQHDLQFARADYGEARGLCRSARPGDTQAIAAGIAELADPDARRMIVTACARLARTNGADEVAEYLGQLAFLRKPRDRGQPSAGGSTPVANDKPATAS